MLIMDFGVEGWNCYIFEYVVDKGNGKVECKFIFVLENVILFYLNECILLVYIVVELCFCYFDLEFLRIDLEDVVFVFLILGFFGFLKVILFFYYVFVVIVWYCYLLFLC